MYTYPNVFSDQNTPVIEIKANIRVKPLYYRSRPISYAMTQKVDNEIDRLLKEDIIEPIEISDWAAPVVPILKGDGSIRLCGDYGEQSS